MTKPPPVGDCAPIGPLTETPDTQPPPLGSWPRLYALVLAVLAVDLVLLWLLTERYR